MAPPAEKTATLNFRVTEGVSEMLRQLAEDAGMSMTDYVATFIRAQFCQRFPKKARAYESPHERMMREIISKEGIDHFLATGEIGLPKKGGK
jgi:hypothetical protein